MENTKNTIKVALKIGNFEIYSYSLFIMLSFCCSIMVISYFWRRQKYSWDNGQVLIILTIIISIISARLWHVIYASTDKSNYPHFNASRDWYKTWEGGSSILGGIIGATLTITIYIIFKRKSIDMRTALDYIFPAILIGQAIGRWGNFTNQEVYGEPVDGNSLNWLPYWVKNQMLINGEYRAPLFLYESISSVIGACIIVFVLNVFNWHKPGTTTGLYFIWYGVVRSIMEPMRDAKNIMRWGSLNSGILVAALFIFFGTLLIIYAYTNKYILSFVKLIIQKCLIFKKSLFQLINSSKQKESTFKENVLKFIKSIKQKNLTYKKILSQHKEKYIRVQVKQRYFFIIFPFKIAIVFISMFHSLFGKNKFKLIRNEKNRKIETMNNTFISKTKIVMIWIMFIFSHIISFTLYQNKKQEKIKQFSKLKCINWKMVTYIWVRKYELSKFQ